MTWRWLLAGVSLPGLVLVVVPAVLLRLFLGTDWAHFPAVPSTPRFWVACLSALLGLLMAAWTASLFIRFGKGTAAPWDPPRRLVVHGPYRHVRNPMMIGVFFILLAESVFLRSWPVAAWCAGFVAANLVYIPAVEEKGLEKRFGRDYTAYKRNVPRWVPRMSAWNGTNDEDGPDARRSQGGAS